MLCVVGTFIFVKYSLKYLTMPHLPPYICIIKQRERYTSGQIIRYYQNSQLGRKTATNSDLANIAYQLSAFCFYRYYVTRHI